MPNTSDHARHQLTEAERGAGMVRMAKVIPAMGRAEFAGEPGQGSEGLPCSGRCGHCDLDPCQLHAPI